MAPRPRHRAAAERPVTGDRRLAGVWQVIADWPTGYDVERYAASAASGDPTRLWDYRDPHASSSGSSRNASPPHSGRIARK